MTAESGYIYVAALSNGTVKVGRSQDAERRLSTHRGNARILGLTVIDSWVSPLHAEWYSNEDALKKIAAGLGGVPQSKEVFSGIEFTAVVERARELTFTEPEPEPEPEATPAPAPAGTEPAADAEKPRAWHGQLTPRERAVALAAVEVGMSAADRAEIYEDGWNTLRPLAVTALLDDGITPADVLAWDVTGKDRAVASFARAMKAMIRFECAIESAIAMKRAAELRREAQGEVIRAAAMHEAATA